jgi:6-phosphogluconolactonase
VAPGVERVVLADADAVARRAAELVADAARRAAAERGRFVIALAGGTTPRIAYERLAELSPMPWAATHVWFGDERCVPPDDPDSNYRMAREALLGRVPIPEAQVTRIEGERAPPTRPTATTRCSAATRSPTPGPGARRSTSCCWAWGRTGTRRRSSPAARRWASARGGPVAVPAPEQVAPRVPRVTLTPPALGASRELLVLATGAEKRGRWRRRSAGAAGGAGDDVPPAGRVRALGRTVWLLDEAAAAGA